MASVPDARRAVFGAGGKPVGEIITLTTCVHAFEEPFLGCDAYIGKTVISWDCVCVWTFDTPTTAPAADQSTTLSTPLGLPSLALPAPYLPAHISDTTNTSLARRTAE
ncbi:MAG: hypothetical protein E8D46_17810 [Nitrospira sp.]|nr:MAG: hypothetical protein E8D46_17810 [Nitrospira sp.]